MSEAELRNCVCVRAIFCGRDGTSIFLLSCGACRAGVGAFQCVSVS